MLILNKIYSETGLFDEVVFKKGINIIQGSYTKPQEEISDLNGIGKSTLVRLIDFALLSDAARSKHFNSKRRNFLENHSVTLEFILDGKIYFIKREFNKPKLPQFGLSKNSLDTYEEDELRIILGKLFFGEDDYSGYFAPEWFRSLVKFFIKDDINHFERDDPLKFTSVFKGQFDAYAYNLFLLDLPNRGIIDYNDLNKQKDELFNDKNKVIGKIKEETGKKIEEISSEIRTLDDKVKSFDKSISDYKFIETYKDVEAKIIEISGKISSSLMKLNQIEKKLSDYKKSYELEIEIDNNHIVELYGEIKELFGEIIKNKLDEVIAFRKKLIENRQKFLISEEINLNQEIDKITAEISALEQKRSNLYKMLNEKNALDSIKNTYALLMEERAKKERLISQVSSVSDIDGKITEINESITKTISNIMEEINLAKNDIEEIHSLFLELVQTVIHVDKTNEAIFDIRPNPAINSPLKITIDVPKSEALGKSRLKILVYDLTVFLNIIEKARNLPYFLVHDGVFHGIDIKVLIRTLNYVYSKYLQNPEFQYIITANEHEIFVPVDKKSTYGDYNFDLKDSVIKTYRDIPAEMIFKQEY